MSFDNLLINKAKMVRRLPHKHVVKQGLTK